MGHTEAREALRAWRDCRPADYSTEPHLHRANLCRAGEGRTEALRPAASRLGSYIAAAGDLIARCEEHLPELEIWDGIGNRIETVRFDPAYHEVGREVWRSGLVALSGTPGRSFEIATLAYLIAHEGEMGHSCPATCTIGLVRALRRRADPALAGRFLPPLLATDWDDVERGSQFLTEVQGGSDVGANAAVARDAGDGTWRVTGEKWFCSVADADQFLVTARPDGAPTGTAGLGCFLIPRVVDGAPNGFRLRRLKDKLGTRAMASGEIDFAEAVAYPIGPLDEGFRTAVTAVLNTSRWLNAVGDVGIMRRAYLEASSYARHRTAFGTPIATFPAVRESLADLKAEWLAALHSTWLLTGLDEAVDTGTADEDQAGLHRFLVNANKFLVSLRATDAARTAIELLGGNGAIETFSPLPRLLRDAVVYEQWEGTHNVLVAQVRRDFGRLGLAGVVFEHFSRLVKGVGHPELGEAAMLAGAALERLEGPVRRAVEDHDYGEAHFRRHLTTLTRVVQTACLLEAAESCDEAVGAAELRAVTDYFARTRLDPAYRPDEDRDFTRRVVAVVDADL